MALLKHYPYITALALSLLSLGVTIVPPTLVQAQSASSSSKLPNQWEGASFQPPTGLGNPDGREGGSTRDGCILQNKYLTALVPASGVGITTANYPTFYWYMPPTTAQTMEFVLLDNQEREIYSALLAVEDNQQGIMSLELPKSATLSPLEVDEGYPQKAEKAYHWQVRLVCQPGDRTADKVVEGVVVRVQPTTKVAQRDNAPLKEKLALYTESRYWYETLSTLGEMRRLNPNDRDISAAWTQLLNSVGLEKIAQEPVVVRSALVIEESSAQSTKARVKQAKLGL